MRPESDRERKRAHHRHPAGDGGGVVLGEDARNVNAVNGLLESAAKSSVAAFVALPGVKASLDGLLPQQVNGVAEYLQDSVTVEADVEELTAPQILLACAATAEALGQGDEVFDLDSLNGLTDGIAALNDAMSQLLDGASQLKAGAAQLPLVRWPCWMG